MNDCVFCKVIHGELPGKFVFRDTDVVAFADISPKAPVHVLIVPVKHIESLQHITQQDSPLMGKLLFVAHTIAKKLGIHDSGYQLSMNNGKQAGQIVFHLHMHLLGGWPASGEVSAGKKGGGDII